MNLKKWWPSSVKQEPLLICILFFARGPLTQYWYNSSFNLSSICVPAGGDILVEPFLSSVSFALKSFGFNGSW